MKKVYLTIDINREDEYFDSFEDFEKWDFEEIIKEKSYATLINPNSLEDIRAELVAEKNYFNKNKPINLCRNSKPKELQSIIEIIRPQKITIEKIYHDNGKRMLNKIEEYEKAYSLHARWLDYSLEYVKHTFSEFEKTNRAN
jgi:hypothetical protein